MTTPEEDHTMSELAAELKANLKLKDRRYHLQTYKQVFLGKEVVDYLVNKGHAADREDAVQLGRALQPHLSFEHVVRDHEFGDNEYFYHFCNRGSLSKDTKGKEQRWNYFLGGAASSDNDSNASSSNYQPRVPSLDAIPDKDRHVVHSVWPLDEHNKELLDHVHPPGWQNPSAEKEYDMVVIGGGAAGLITAAGCAGVGARVALIEAHMLGGDCLNVGCVPSKTIIHSANLAHEMRTNNRAGVIAKEVTVDFEAVMERVRKVRADISHHDSAERYSSELGVDIYIGWAQFASERTVTVNGEQTLKFLKAAICTGGYPVLLDIPGLKNLHKMAMEGTVVKRPQIMTNETVFNLTRKPKNMVVVGAGVIGMELAQAMQRLGVQVTVLGRSGKVLPKEDTDLADVVKEQMVKDGVEFRLGVTEYQKVELTGNVLEENGHLEMKLIITEKEGGTSELVIDALLVAAGRAPNVSGMNLETAGVEYDLREGLKVNDMLQTTNKRIFGVGDVCSQYKFTHAADFMARMVIRNALFWGKGKMSSLLIPYATFTSPEIASVGLYESDLKERGIAFRTFEKHFKDNDRALADDSTEGLVRFRVDAKTDKIWGASIVGKDAGNMISEVTLAMQSDTGLGSLANVIHPYPTTASVLREAGDLYNRTKLTPTVKRVLRGVVRVQR